MKTLSYLTVNKELVATGADGTLSILLGKYHMLPTYLSSHTSLKFGSLILDLFCFQTLKLDSVCI
jgi:hypothetical protein